MASYPEDFLEVQWARESTPGTDLPTTSKMIVERFAATPAGPELYRPALAMGALLANRGGEMIIQRGTNLVAEGPFTFEQAQHHFSGVIANDAAPTGSGPYTWDHVRAVTAVPSLATFTIEQRITDKVTPIDMAWHYCTYNSLELRLEPNDVWRYTANLFARAYQMEALTPAISLPTFEIPKVPGTTVHIDSTWGAIGTTQVVGQVLSGTIRLAGGAAPRWTLDGRADSDWGDIAFGSTRVTAELDLMIRIGAQYTIERAAALAMTNRAVRVKVMSGTKAIQIDMLLKHANPDLIAVEVDEEEFVCNLQMKGTYDGTNAWAAQVINNVATFV